MHREDRLQAAINRLPRIPIGVHPTPIEALPRLSSTLGGPPIYMKRDDLTGLAFGGNKTRMLEFSLADALKEGADTVVTGMAVQSNYCRQMAAACAKTGLDLHLVLRPVRPIDREQVQGNNLLQRLFGAHIQVVAEDDRAAQQASIVATAERLRDAIAAALVPPLCVVGYGLGMSNLDIAAGAMLLFTTNLIAIIFAAAMTFLALGFHPPRAARGNLARSLRLTILSLAAIAVVLIVATVTTVHQERVRQAVDATFERLVDERSARIVEVLVQRNLSGHLITATVISFPDGDLTAATLGELEATLEDAVGGPIEMDVTVLQGWRDDLANIDKRVMLTDMLEEEISESGGAVSEAESSFEASQYTVKATILVYDGHTLTVEVMRALQEEMSAAVAAPVLLETTYLQAVHAELDVPTPTPDP